MGAYNSSRYTVQMTRTRILQEHSRRNETTRDRWDVMAPHRANVTRLIVGTRGTGGSLCILGAGNGNDIDLIEIAKHFAHITLVDLDEKALRQLENRTPVTKNCDIAYCGKVDITGTVSHLEELHNDASNQDVDAVIELAKNAKIPSIGAFDVVCSSCILTQIIDSVCMALPSNHPRFLELVMAARDRHLGMIVDLLNAGGTGILVTDFVSSTTAPELAHIDEAQLSKTALRWISERNFFTGANPIVLRNFYRTNLTVGPMVQSTELTRPWRWDIGEKQFAVCAVVVKRSDS